MISLSTKIKVVRRKFLNSFIQKNTIKKIKIARNHKITLILTKNTKTLI